MTNIYWTRLNENPLPTLPASEGAQAVRQFEEVSRALKAKRTLKDLNYHEASSECGVNFQRVNKNGKDDPITPSNALGSFIYWPHSCGRKLARIPPHVSLGDIAVSYLRSIRYPSGCGPNGKVDPDWKFTLLPEQYLGIFFIDWDQDGDIDLAFLLAGGQYVFFRRESCGPVFS